MIYRNEYIRFSRLFNFPTSWWEVIMINFTEYIDFVRYPNLLLGGQTDRFTRYIGFFYFSTFYWEVKMIDSTEYIVFYRFFDLLVEGQID